MKFHGFLVVLYWFTTNISVAVSQSVVLNVRDFGALGNGQKDDTFAIQAAIDTAYNRNGSVFFPNGVYSISQIDIKVSIYGEKESVIKNNKKKLSQYTFCNVRKKSSLYIKSITFDGSVHLNESGELVEGSIPLFIYKGNMIIIQDCIFLNSSMSGLRVEDSENIQIKNCFSGHHKGVFGDGYYLASVKNSSIENCIAQDYTRIGFVTEENSSDIIVIDCEAINGNSGSILNGGTEYNAGFWYENSINIKTINCKASDNTHRGFVATTGGRVSNLTNEQFSYFVFKNCESNRNPIGFVVGSMGFPVNVSLQNCSANNVSTGFHINAKNVYDRFQFDTCTVVMNPLPKNSLNNVGFNWEGISAIQSSKNSDLDLIPEIYLNNCKVQYLEPSDIGKLYNPNSNSADISTYGGGKVKIIINSFTNSFLGNEIIIKARTGNPKYKINNTLYMKRFIAPLQIIK